MRAILMFAILLSASAALADTPVGDAATAGPSETIPRSVFAVDDHGDATHVQTGWQCPATFGDYRRDDLHIFNAYGLDVSCDYRLGRQDAIVTLYLTKVGAGSDIKAAFAQAQGALVQRMTGAALLPDAEQKTFASDRAWLHAIYATQDGRSRDGVWYAWYGDWAFEIRASWSPQLTDAVLAELSTMTDAARGMGAHLARCAAAPPPPRDGRPILDEDKLSQLSMMAGITAGAANLPDPKTGKLPADLSHKPSEWCAEGGVAAAADPVLLWYGLSADGTVAPADRAMLMTDGDPPVLEVAADPELNIILSELAKGANAPPLYVVTLRKGDDTILLGFFEGRPDGGALAQILSNLRAGRARSFGSFNGKTSTITISVPSKPNGHPAGN